MVGLGRCLLGLVSYDYDYCDAFIIWCDHVMQVFNDVIVFSNSHLLMNQHNKLVFSVAHQIERCLHCV